MSRPRSWCIVNISTWDGPTPADEANFPGGVSWVDDDLEGSSDGAYDVHNCETAEEARAQAEDCARGNAEAYEMRLAFVEWNGVLVYGARRTGSGSWRAIRGSSLPGLSSALATRNARAAVVTPAEREEFRLCTTGITGGACEAPAVVWERTVAYGVCSYCPECAREWRVPVSSAPAVVS